MLSAKKKRYFTEVHKLLKAFTFAIPIMLTGIFRFFYNIAANIVTEQFSGTPNPSMRLA